MVIGLLALAAIPTVTGISLGISERSKPQTMVKERARMRKFTMTCWCEGRSRGKAAVHGGHVVLGDGKMWIQSRKATPERRLYPFNGFYLDYPDDKRPPPAPTGLVTMVSDDPPMMNWIYIDTATWEVKHGNRTQSRKHWVGNFGWTSENDDEDFDTEPGGLVFQGEERFVALEPRKGSREAAEGRWEVFWDPDDDKLQAVLSQHERENRLVLRISLERAMIEELEDGAASDTVNSGAAAQGPKNQPAAATGTGTGNNTAKHAEEAHSTQQHAGQQILHDNHQQAALPNHVARSAEGGK